MYNFLEPITTMIIQKIINNLSTNWKNLLPYRKTYINVCVKCKLMKCKQRKCTAVSAVWSVAGVYSLVTSGYQG